MKPHTARITRVIRIGALLVIFGLCAPVFAQFSAASRESGWGRPKSESNAPALAPNQSEPPTGFDVPMAGGARGKITSVEFESKRGGGTFRATVYTPPGFSASEKYPVLYLLHGASGDENTWAREIRAGVILDNLFAGKKLAPMIVVMPSSLSVAAREQAGNNRDARQRASMAFEGVLLRDLMPFVESAYPVRAGREHSALAGLSMGAGLALNIGLTHPEKFGWVGVFSGGSARRLADISTERQPRLLWLSVGNRDALMARGMADLDAFLTRKEIPHVFRINTGGHEPRVWMSDLYHFAQMLFASEK